MIYGRGGVSVAVKIRRAAIWGGWGGVRMHFEPPEALKMEAARSAVS